MTTEKYGRYEVIRELGRGGMATVYVARDPRFGRDVALKVLPPGFLQDPTFRKRFDVEARFIAQLEHAAIVPVYDYGDDHGRPYLVMRLMLGGTLRDRISQGPLPLDDVVGICQRICWALEKAHSRGIIHRDIKPPNILCDEDGAAYLADFGIARLAEATQTVTAMGTPQYIAPEQVYGTALDGRTDIYQMGVVLFEMLTGRRPFEADNSAALIYKHCHERVPSARSFNPALNAVADAVIERAMAKEMGDRYATAGDFAAAVAKIPLARPGAQRREEATDYHPPDLETRERRGRKKETPRRRASKPPERATPPRQERVLVETEPWAPLEVAELAGRQESEPATTPPRDDGLELVDSDPKMPWQEGGGEPAPEPSAEPEPAVVTASPGRPEDAALGVRVQIAAPPALPAKPSGSRLARVLERGKYERAIEEHQENYRHYLAERREELQRLRDEHLASLHRRDPSPADCLEQMEKDPACLWARTPGDTNFLALRAGRGRQPFPIAIDLPPTDPNSETDPLFQEAIDLADEFRHVTQAPIIFPLAAYGALGTIGPDIQLLNLARGLVMQIATHHRPDQVKIVALFPHAEAAQWEWLRWLPHVWTDDRQRRFLACYPDAAHNLLIGLYDLLVARRETREAQQPTYLFLLADPSLIDGEPILPLLLEEGSGLGVYPLFFSERPESLPQGLRAAAEVGPIISRLILSDRPQPIEFSPDDVPAQTAVRFSRLLASIRPATPAPATEPYAEVTLLDVLGVSDVAALDVVSRWRASRPWKSLAAPLGRTSCSDLVSLDIHDEAHGPDGLVAGMAGARSRSLLRSLIASLAVHHHPHELALLLADPQGEELVAPFRELPHLAGAITDPVAATGDRLLRTLESESRRRAVALSAAGVDHHDAYLEKARADESLAPLPHLLIIVNQGADRTGSTDLARDLIGLANTGRTLGMHLLIVLQEPAELIPTGPEALFHFCLCPPPDELAESQRPVEGTTAAVATPPGRLILRVGPATVGEPFEVAWSGAPCSAGGFAARDPHEILEVALDGSRQPLRLSTTPLRIEAAATQLEAVVAHIVAVAEREAIEPLAGPLLS